VLLLCTCLQYFLKHEAAEALEGLKETPQKLAGALGTAAEIGGGVLQHIGEKVGDAAHMVAHPGARTAGNVARQQRAEVRGVWRRSGRGVACGVWNGDLAWAQVHLCRCNLLHCVKGASHAAVVSMLHVACMLALQIHGCCPLPVRARQYHRVQFELLQGFYDTAARSTTHPPCNAPRL
jgi:hypothetical protein